MKRVLALVNIGDDPPGHLGEIMQEHGIAYDAICVEDTPLPDPTGYAAIIALGGPQHAAADDKHPYLAQEKVLIRKAVEQDIPYLGICLGGQLLALALGARVTKHHMIELGFLEVELTEEGKADPLFQGLPVAYGCVRYSCWRRATGNECHCAQSSLPLRGTRLWVTISHRTDP